MPPEGPALALFSSALPGWSAARVVGTAVALDVAITEWGAGPGQALAEPDDWRRAGALCAARGLAIAGVAVQDPAATLDLPERVLPYLQLAAALGAPLVRVFPPAFAGGSLAAAQDACRAGLARLVEKAEPLGVRVLVEVAPGTVAPSPALLVALLEGHGPERVGALYDPGNMVMEGWVGPRLAVAQLGPHLAHVHVKNVVWQRRDGSWRIAYARLGDGLVDWPAVLAALAAAGYRGLLAFDHLRGAPSRAELRRELDHLRGLLAAPHSDIVAP